MEEQRFRELSTISNKAQIQRIVYDLEISSRAREFCWIETNMRTPPVLTMTCWWDGSINDEKNNAVGRGQDGIIVMVDDLIEKDVCSN